MAQISIALKDQHAQGLIESNKLQQHLLNNLHAFHTSDRQQVAQENGTTLLQRNPYMVHLRLPLSAQNQSHIS